MSEERATYGEEQPDITDDNWKLAELEASCAGMRRALEQVDGNLRDPEQQVPGTTATFVNLISIEYIAEALSTDAGKELLASLDAKDERIEELEEALTKLVNAYHGLYVANQFNCGRKTNDEKIENIPVIKAARKVLGEKGDEHAKDAD